MPRKGGSGGHWVQKNSGKKPSRLGKGLGAQRKQHTQTAAQPQTPQPTQKRRRTRGQ